MNCSCRWYTCFANANSDVHLRRPALRGIRLRRCACQSYLPFSLTAKTSSHRIAAVRLLRLRSLRGNGNGRNLPIGLRYQNYCCGCDRGGRLVSKDRLGYLRICGWNEHYLAVSKSMELIEAYNPGKQHREVPLKFIGDKYRINVMKTCCIASRYL